MTREGRIAKTPRTVAVMLLKPIVSVVLLSLILRGTDFAAIWSSLRGANGWLLLLAFSLHLIGFTISAHRWRLLLRTRDSDASILFLIKSYIVGMFFNNFLPSTIGGDAYRAYDSWRLGQSKSSAVAVVFVDRFLGLLALMLFALLALLHRNVLTQSIPWLFFWVTLGTLGMILFVWAIFAPPRWLPRLVAELKLPLGGKVQRVAEAFLAFEGERRALLLAFGLSLLLQANVVLHYFIIARALQLPIPLTSFFLIIPLATLIMMLPISVNGIGVRESVYIFFFAPFAVAAPHAIAFSWAAYGMVVLQGLIGGVVYALRE